MRNPPYHLSSGPWSHPHSTPPALCGATGLTALAQVTLSNYRLDRVGWQRIPEAVCPACREALAKLKP